MASTTSGYDGSIKIDTRLDSKGFNIGMKEMQKTTDRGMDAISSVLSGMSSKFKGLGATASAALGKIGAVGSTIGAVLGGIIVVLGLIVVAIVKVVSSMIKLAAAAAKAGITMLNTMGEAVSKTSLYGKAIQDLKDLITDIKGAWYAAFAPLVQFVTPYVRMLSEWLVKVFNTIAMIIAKLLGQKTVMQYIAGSAKEADKLAKNTRKAGEAAEGALAAFDQLNVLQTEKGSSGDQEAGKMQFAEVAVNEGIIKESWEKIKEWGLKAYEWIKENGLRILQFLAISAALVWNTVWEKYKEAVAIIWERVKEGWKSFWDGVKNVALAIWDRIKQGAAAAWDGIKNVFRALGEWFRNNVWNPLREKFSEAWSRVKELASAAWGDIKRIWGIVREWFRANVTDPLRNAFKTALDAIGGFFKSKFDAIKEIIVKVLNFIIDRINGLITRIVSGLNAVIGLLNKLSIPLPAFLGGGSIGFNIPKLNAPQIPRLATGAVIPPNSEFLAVLGDQKRGTNVEAPEDLIRQIVREETASIGEKEVTINFAGSMGALIRSMKPYIDRENARVGKSLVRGIA